MPKKFTNICRAKKIPAETAKAFGMEKIEGNNRLEVVFAKNENEPVEIILSGSIGKSWFDDSGITESEVRDALNSIPRGKKISVRGNSEGGSVQEGLGIYDAFSGRRDDITYHVAGYALSIASVFPLAAHKVVSPKSAIWMIHKAHCITGGNADDKLADAEMLAAHDQVMSEIYAESNRRRNPATMRTPEQFLALMKDETWIRGSKAVEFGLADEGDETETAQASYVPINNLYFSKLKNASPEILNALRVSNSALPTQGDGNNKPQPQSKMKKKLLALLQASNVSNATDAKSLDELIELAQAAITDEKLTQAKFDEWHNEFFPQNQRTKTPAAQGTVTRDDLDLRAELAAIKRDRVADKINPFVTEQKITKAEAKMFIAQALTSPEAEAEVMEILAAKQSQAIGGDPAGAHVVTVEDGPMTSKNGVQGSKVIPELDNLFAATLNDGAKRYNEMKAQFGRLLAAAYRRDNGVLGENTFSGTVTTNFLIMAVIQKLTNRFAAANLFTRDNSQDPFKPLAVGVQKFNTTATDGSQVQTNLTDFENGGDSVISALTITPAQYTSNGHLTNAQLQNGFRVADIIEKKLIDLAAKLTQVFMAPITVANFTTNVPVVSAPAAFGFSDLANLLGILKKTRTKNLILDGEYIARISNQPGFFQKTGTGADDSKAYQAYGWDNIALNTDWSGAGANVRGFGCGQDAIGIITGLPLTPPTGIPGNTVQQGVAMLPDVGIGIQTNVWFSPRYRTFWFSFDAIAGATLVDETQGVIIKSA